MSEKTTNISYLNTLRALATLGVIIIHISSPLVNMTFGKNMDFWWIGNIVDSAVRFAVPLFLMLSGATLLGKESSMVSFYKRRFTRVLVPFIFWLIIYWVYRYAMLLPQQKPIDFATTINWDTELFLKEGVSKHFWYIYMILFIYLIIPFVNSFFQNLKHKTVVIILFAWLLLTIFFKSTPMNLYGWSDNYGSKFLGYFLHSGYLVLGLYVSKYLKINNKIRSFAIFIYICSVLFSAVYTYMVSNNAHKLDLSMYSYLSINTIIQSIALFLCFKNIDFQNKWVVTTQNMISNYSYGIYLVHILVIGILFRNGIFWNISHPILSLPFLTISVLTISFVIIYTIRKLPFGKHISG